MKSIDRKSFGFISKWPEMVKKSFGYLSRIGASKTSDYESSQRELQKPFTVSEVRDYVTTKHPEIYLEKNRPY